MNARTIHEGQSKFNFYLVALAFSILGLAIKSLDPHVSGIPFYAELAAWTLLLASALFALSYVEWSSKAQDLNTVEVDIRELLAEATDGTDATLSSNGKTFSLTQVREAHLASLVAQKKALTDAWAEQWVSEEVKYGIAKWGFLCGVLLLATSRLFQNLAGFVAR